MGLFITGFVISILFLIICIVFAFKAYKRKKEVDKIVPFDRKRKKENYSVLLSFCSAIFSIFVMFFTLLNSIPVPTIYPLENKTNIYNGTVEVTINSNPLLKTYYSLDGSDPMDGYLYETSLIITQPTTITARNKFLLWWSDISKSEYEQIINVDINITDEDVDQNFDLIQQLKAEYSDADIIYIKDDKVKFEISERAGYIYQDSMKTGECIILRGEPVFTYKLAIIDYDSDEVIYTFTSENSEYVEYSPGNDNKFYIVVLNNEYDIYVSPPIKVIGGEYYGIVKINLDKSDFQYTPPIQCCLHIQDSNADESDSVDFSNYSCEFNFRNIHSYNVSKSYLTEISDLGIISWGQYTYFSLNTNYIMDISCFRKSNERIKSKSQVIDGSITDSNIIDIYIEF